MKPLIEIAAERGRRKVNEAIDDSKATIDELTIRIEEEIQKNPELRARFEELQFKKELNASAEYYRIKGGNAYRICMLSSAAAIGFGVAGAVVTWPYFIAAGVALFVRIISMDFIEEKYKNAQEVLQREPLHPVQLKPDAIDTYIAELNKLKTDDELMIEAKSLEQDLNHIWISAGDGYSGYRVANLYRDRGVVTDFYTTIKMPTVVPLERLPIKWFKELVGLEQPEFSCPAHGISRARDQTHYQAAKQVREVALKYAA